MRKFCSVILEVLNLSLENLNLGANSTSMMAMLAEALFNSKKKLFMRAHVLLIDESSLYQHFD